MNFVVLVEFVPPGVVTLTSYTPIVTPDGITAPVIKISLTTVYPVRGVEAPSLSLTAVTLFEPTPPKKPLPVILTVVEDKLDPIDGLTNVTVGTGIELVTVNSIVLVLLVPPVVVTFTL